MSETRKVAANTAVQVAGRFASALLAIFTLSLILRFFGEELQGRYLLAMAFAQFVSTIADFGLGTYLVRAIAGQEIAASQGMAFRFYTAIPFYAIAVVVGFLLPYDDPTRQAILIALISAFIISMNNALVVYYQAKLRMQIPAVSEVANKVVVYALTAAVIALGWPFIWSVVVVAVGAAANFLINFLIGRRDLPYSGRANISSWPAIFKETLPLWVVSVLILIYFRIDTLMLSVLSLPNGQNNLVQVGYYSTAYKFLEMLIAVPMMFYGAVLPVLVSAKENIFRLKEIVTKSLYAIMLFAVPATVLVYFGADGLINLFFGNYAPAASALAILIWAFLFSAVSTGFYFATIGLGAQRRLVAPYLIVSGLNIALNYYLIPRFGFYGAAWATVVTEALIIIVTYRVVRSVIGTGAFFSRSLIKVFLAGAATAVLLWLLKLNFWPEMIVGAASYLTILVLIKGVDIPTVRALWQRDAT